MNGLSLKPYDSSPKWNAVEMLGDAAEVARGVAGIVMAIEPEGMENVYASDSLELLRALMLCVADTIGNAAEVLR